MISRTKCYQVKPDCLCKSVALNYFSIPSAKTDVAIIWQGDIPKTLILRNVKLSKQKHDFILAPLRSLVLNVDKICLLYFVASSNLYLC